MKGYIFVSGISGRMVENRRKVSHCLVGKFNPLVHSPTVLSALCDARWPWVKTPEGVWFNVSVIQIWEQSSGYMQWMSEPGSPAFLDDDCYRQPWLCLSWMLPSDSYEHFVVNTHLPCLETLRLYLLSLYKVITFSYTFYLPKTFWDISPTFAHSLILYKYIFFSFTLILVNKRD